MSQAYGNEDLDHNVTNKSSIYNDIASKLLKDHFLLTALEFHTELLESGRELRQLRDYFSNPKNFEPQIHDVPSRMSRSGSQVTLDSLDLTRYSEDGAGGDEKVAVLEFELRKAKETINDLRNNLTLATESESSTPDKGSSYSVNLGKIKPHEQRALNFLINEYLLLHEYKLTSITFADENQHQDFDDWDDVGLNIPKLPELLTLYRDGLKQSGQNCISSHTQTDVQYSTETNESNVETLLLEIQNLKLQLAKLEEQQSNLKQENLNLQKGYEVLLSTQISDPIQESSPILPVKKCNGSDDDESPEKFELVYANAATFKKRDSINTIDDSISNNSFNTNEWTSLSLNIQEQTVSEKFEERILDSPVRDFNSKPSSQRFAKISKGPFTQEVFSLCYVNIPVKIDKEIVNSILNNSMANKALIHTLTISLLKIIPNIILNKREEVLPLLISAVCLNPNSQERDKLLQQLFNLKKKPTDSDRAMMLSGLIAIADCSEESLVENEMLPQCWEQLNHKHMERRLLAVEACTALIPYVSSPIRHSLMLSIFQQMLDDKEEAVREVAIKGLIIITALCDDDDKYNQCEELALSTLNEPSNKIINLSTQILFPALAEWALQKGCLRSELLKQLLYKLNKLLKESDSTNSTSQFEHIHRILIVLDNLLPFLLVCVSSSDHILSKIAKNIPVELRTELVKLCSELTIPTIFYHSQFNIGLILYEFEKHILEYPGDSWSELDWVLDMLIPDLLNSLHHLEVNQHYLLETFIRLFSSLCIVFGKTFTKHKVQPLMQSQIQNLEQMLSNYNQLSLSLNILPVYLISVLAYNNDCDEILKVLKMFLCSLPLCGAPMDCVEVSIRGLCEIGFQETVLTGMWSGIVHQRPLVRAATATLLASIVGVCEDNLLCFKVTPAIVTLASDNDILVKTATIPALGKLIMDCKLKEIHEKAYMQLQSYMSENNLQENHTFFRQLIVTLGNVANHTDSTFRKDVILPQLSTFVNTMPQMTNQTRKIDIVLASIEAFTNIVYSPLNKHLEYLVLPSLRCLEVIVNENQSLISHKETINSMIQECDSKLEVSPPPLPADIGIKLSQNVNQGVEEMRQRVSKIFTKPVSSKPNLQNIFKKK